MNLAPASSTPLPPSTLRPFSSLHNASVTSVLCVLHMMLLFLISLYLTLYRPHHLVPLFTPYLLLFPFFKSASLIHFSLDFPLFLLCISSDAALPSPHLQAMLFTPLPYIIYLLFLSLIAPNKLSTPFQSSLFLSKPSLSPQFSAYPTCYSPLPAT